MGLPRRVPRVDDSKLPRGFPGRRMPVLAAITQAALRRAGYDTYFLNDPTERWPSLSIGMTGDSDTIIGVGVGDFDHPGALADARSCAQRLNEQLQSAASSARGLATVYQGRTSIGGAPFIEVRVQCPNDPTLRALHKALVK